MRPLPCLLWLALAVAARAQERPPSLLMNGGFERGGGWNRTPNTSLVVSDRGDKCLLVDGSGSVFQDVIPGGQGRTFSCSMELKTENVQPGAGGGYAYAAIYQLDATGQWVAFKDFIIKQGTNDWQRHDFTFELVPGAIVISARCGIYNGTGKAWFDNWTLVEGPRSYALSEVSDEAIMPRADNSIAVLREPGLPVKGAGSSPDRLGKLLSDAGFEVIYLSVADLADARKLKASRYGMVVLPYGQSFPAQARWAMTAYLHNGGSFISTGGYAFNNLLLQENGEWLTEKAVCERKLAAALAQSLLADGGFETTTEAPIRGMKLDGKWRRDGDIATIVEESPKEGTRCAKIVVSPAQPREDRWYLDLKPQSGARYRVSGWIKTQDVTPIGHGFAYMALYEYGDNDRLGKWRDFAQVTGTTDWQQFQYDFTPEAATKRIHIKMGLYRATGTAWFDDIRLANIANTKLTPMNTSTGSPGDGLGVAASQIGTFDASYPLRRVARTQPAPGQFIFAADSALEAPLAGWAASGVVGTDNARWIPLLEGRDRFGRERGAVAALMANYNGFFAGSLWGYFGAENRDLFDGSCPWLDRGFVSLARFISRGTFLRNLSTNLAGYRDGETVKLTVTVANFGSREQSGRVVFCVLPEGDASRVLEVGSVALSVPAADSRPAECTWSPGAFASDLYRVIARLELGGQPADEMDTGFMALKDEVARSGPELRFRDNYFRLNGRPTFLFGSDTYANVYGSSCENPWTWHLDHVAARDFGFNVYENLQFCNPPGYEYTDAQWRQFEAMAQSTQREGLVFMPCQLCGHNVAIDEPLLERQAAECKAYGAHMAKYPGLLYYLNGDFQYNPSDTATMTALWNQWLADKYKTPEALKESWGDEFYGEWGKLAYPPLNDGRWNSTRACDKARFDIWVTCRWVERHVAAVRSEDTVHPITSEYYQNLWGAIDLVLTIGSQDASNIGYFDLPYRDEENLPLKIRLNDLRMRGKGVGLGEYGVKTHPAWGLDNGASGYHIQRTEEEQNRLFMTVAHYGLGLGACKVQNWCLRDASENVFPWGVFYPNGRLPKDVAAVHRNLSLVWRYLPPVYAPPATAVLLPDSLRLGNGAWTGVEVALNAFRALLGLHRDFNVINEEHLGALTNQTKTLIWPSPMCPGDEAYARVLQWVKDGGSLILTGDLSYNWDRKHTRTERLKELCGVEWVRELHPPSARNTSGAETLEYLGWELTVNPCVEVRVAGATVGASMSDGRPAIIENRLGRGRVLYCTDPLEMGAAGDVAASLRSLYESLAGPRGPAPPTAPGPDIHLCRQALLHGGEFAMAYNTNMPPDVQRVPFGVGRTGVIARVAGRYPAMGVASSAGDIVAVGCSGEAQDQDGPLVTGDAQVIYLSLDGRPLTGSSAVLLCPFGTGRTALASKRPWQDPVLVVGDIADGHWRTFETRSGRPELTLDEDLMTCLILVCERAEIAEWTQALADAMRYPDRVEGY